MLVLAMTTTRGDKIPAIILNHPDYITDFHKGYLTTFYLLSPSPFSHPHQLFLPVLHTFWLTGFTRFDGVPLGF